MLGPIFTAVRLVNTAASAYVCGKIGWEAFKGIRGAQKEVLRAKVLRERFVVEYEKENGEEPSEEIIQIALRSYNAVERPLMHKVRQIGESVTTKVTEAVDAGLERAGRLLESRKKE